MLSANGGFVPENGDPLADWVIDWVNAPVRLDNLTKLVGEVADQAQLHGLLARIWDLGLELESMTVFGPRAEKDKEP